MNTFLTIILIISLMIISGCSDQASQTESDKHDHVLRQQIDVMNDAKSITQTLNQNTKVQNEQASELTGH